MKKFSINVTLILWASRSLTLSLLTLQQHLRRVLLMQFPDPLKGYTFCELVECKYVSSLKRNYHSRSKIALFRLFCSDIC